jgi:hypothetical protein
LTSSAATLGTGRDLPGPVPERASLYYAKGYFEKNGLGAYSPNDPTAELHPGGAVTIQFGGCQRETPNCLPIMSGRNYLGETVPAAEGNRRRLLEIP